MTFGPGQHGHVADQEAKVVELAAFCSVAEIARETGLGEPTVRKLLNAHEIEAQQVVDPRVVERRFERLADGQLSLAEQLTAKALALVAEDALIAEAERTQVEVGLSDKVLVPLVSAKDRTDRLRAIQAITQASASAVDKASLLSGRATDRVEVADEATFDDARRLVARIVDMQTGGGPKPKAIDAKVVE
jgi:hypothetical protein